MSRALPHIWSLTCCVFLAILPKDVDAGKSQRVYTRTIGDQNVFETYSRVVGSDRFAKFIIDVKTDEIYFIDVNVFKIHADFVLDVLLKKPWSAETIREYNKNYEREKPLFVLGYITEHLDAGKMTFSFWEGDKISPEGVERTHKKLAQTFFKPLAFRPDSPRQQKVGQHVAKKGIPVITNDRVYHLSTFQPFNKGRAIGLLRVVPKGTPFEELVFNQTDIVLLQETYPDISPVSGILTTVLSTPLSHVNLRATAWGAPNATNVNALRRYRRFNGKLVLYEVGPSGMKLRAATLREKKAYRRNIHKKLHIEVPVADKTTSKLAMLSSIGKNQSKLYGAKTANLGEIAGAGLAQVYVPKGVGIPFSYYVRHLKQHGLDKELDALLSDRRFESNIRWRKSALAQFRKRVTEPPIDPDLLSRVSEIVRRDLGPSVFVRSSTNAEDLPGFNGAGLYETVPNVRSKRSLGRAIKTVWASLWNFRAVEERRLFGIDQRTVFAGVLVQTGVNATAAGVLVTSNLFDPTEKDAYTINAKWGLGIRVVEGKRVPEQIIFDTSNDGTKIISRSDDPVMLVFDEDEGIREVPTNGNPVILTEERAKRLSGAVTSFLSLFSKDSPLDVEWLLEGEKVWIVQARPYISSSKR